LADIIFPGTPPADTLGITKLPNNMDLSIWQGDAQRFVIKMTAQDGSAIDLSGYTASAVIRQSFTAPVSFHFDCTIQNGNEVALYLSSAVCKTIPAGPYVWSFELIEVSTGDARTYLAGDAIVYAEVEPV
jgi:hypothetical protein